MSKKDQKFGFLSKIENIDSQFIHPFHDKIQFKRLFNNIFSQKIQFNFFGYPIQQNMKKYIFKLENPGIAHP